MNCELCALLDKTEPAFGAQRLHLSCACLAMLHVDIPLCRAHLAASRIPPFRKQITEALLQLPLHERLHAGKPCKAASSRNAIADDSKGLN